MIDMSDAMRYTPSSIEAKRGGTIRFMIEHDALNMVTVAPGKTGQLLWKFAKAGKIDLAYQQLRHCDAGMKGAVNVASVKGVPMKADDHGAPVPEFAESTKWPGCSPTSPSRVARPADHGGLGGLPAMETPQVSEGAIFQERGAALATRSRSTATDPIIRPDGGPAAPPCHLAHTPRTVVRVPTLPGSPHEHPNDR